MKAAKPLHIVLATNPNPTRARGYPLNINPKPDSISGPAGSGRVADLYCRVVIEHEFECADFLFVNNISIDFSAFRTSFKSLSVCWTASKSDWRWLTALSSVDAEE